MFRRSGMYGPDDTPQGEGNPSFIKVDLVLRRENPEYHGEPIIVQLAVFDQEVWDKGLGEKLRNKNGEIEQVYCCTQELVAAKVCDEPMTLILKEDKSEGTYVTNIEFLPDPNDKKKTQEQSKQITFSIPYKGLKYLLFSSCNDMAGQISIDGKTEWKNPYGYLPGELFGFLGFFSHLAAFYIVIGAIWAIACARHWRELMILQNYVTIVLALGMMEMALRYYDFAQFNINGTRGTGLMLSSSVLHTVKQTVSRLLVLVVSMGFGIVKPTLGDSFNTIAGLGGLFFFFAVVQRVYELSSHTSAITFMQYVTMLPVAALDLVFFFWIFRSLSDIIAQLENREQGVKLQLYKRFRIVLIITMLLACGWSLIYSFIVVSGRISADWESRWMFDGFFDVLYVFVLIMIMVLWRPTNNAAQFAYARVRTRDIDDDDEEYGNGLEDEEPEEAQASAAPKTAQVAPEKNDVEAAVKEDVPTSTVVAEEEKKPAPPKKEKKPKVAQD